MNLIKVPEANNLYLNPETEKFIYSGRLMDDQSDDFEFYNPVTDTTTTMGYWRKKLLPKHREPQIEAPTPENKAHVPDLSSKSKEERLAALKAMLNPTKDTQIQVITKNQDTQPQKQGHTKARLGHANGKNKGIYIINDQEYTTIRQASKATGWSKDRIANNCYNNKNNCSFLKK